MKEEWRPVPGWQWVYQVSSLGNVRRMDGRLIKQWPNSEGYATARLSCPRELVRVHRLVALAFIQNEKNRPSVNHIDCNRSNNEVSNLEWCTQKENLAHMTKLGRRATPQTGRRSFNAKLSEHQVSQIRLLYSKGEHSWASLAAWFGISKRTAGRIVKGESYVR